MLIFNWLKIIKVLSYMLLVKLVEVEYAGRLKEMKGKIQKTSGKEEPQDEQAGAVDQIKKKYGFSYSNVSKHV